MVSRVDSAPVPARSFFSFAAASFTVARIASISAGRSSTDSPVEPSAPNRFFVVERFAAQGRVDHQIDLARFHQVHNVRPAFVHFEYRFGLDAGRFQRRRSSSSRKQAKTQRRQLFSKSSQMLFVTVVYAEENRTLARQALPRRKLGLRESLSVRCRNPHYFAR